MSVSTSTLRSIVRRLMTPAALLSLFFALTSVPAMAAVTVTQKFYPAPETAASALIDAARTGDKKGLGAIFGSAGSKLGNNDPVMAKIERQTFVEAYAEKHSIQTIGDSKATLVVGANDWPFPVPLVKNDKGWRFDTSAGLEEVTNRRIGRNELHAIQVLLAVVDAQHDYATMDREADGLRDYAQRFASSPGKRDGLYWPVKPGEAASPLGELAAEAVEEGYSAKGQKPRPYWGYYFRILTAQGLSAKGGAYSYLAGTNMIGGFAVLAYPAEYGESGVKSFIVNHDGVVYEKDLGAKTHARVAEIMQFNPDAGAGWKEAKQ